MDAGARPPLGRSPGEGQGAAAAALQGVRHVGFRTGGDPLRILLRDGGDEDRLRLPAGRDPSPQVIRSRGGQPSTAAARTPPTQTWGVGRVYPGRMSCSGIDTNAWRREGEFRKRGLAPSCPVYSGKKVT